MTRSLASQVPTPADRLFALAHDLLGTASFDGYLICVNPAWELTLGWSDGQLMAAPFATFIHLDDRAIAEKLTASLFGPEAPAMVTIADRVRTSDGIYRSFEWTVTADEGGFYYVGRDITDRNATELESDLAASLMEAIVESTTDGLVVCDADGGTTFVNPAGVRLLGYERGADLRGPSFHATFHHSHADGTPFEYEKCPMQKVRRGGRPIHVQEDVFWRKDGSSFPVAYSAAPIDLVDGTGSVVAFRDISAQHRERERVRTKFSDVAWFEEVRLALANHRLIIYGQPIVDIATGETALHELLLRILLPTGKILEAGEFIHAAETFGLVDEIDRWVITEAIEIAASGRKVAINLSAESVGRDEILSHIERELARTGATPSNLVFEVTETAVMDDLAAGRRFAERLVALGCAFALDDFGTGYGSFTYLRQLPIAYLKIDIQFVREMIENEEDRQLVRTIVAIAQSLDKKTIAEGVDDDETLRMLGEFGVDLAQGYHLGRPDPLPTKWVDRS